MVCQCKDDYQIKQHCISRAGFFNQGSDTIIGPFCDRRLLNMHCFMEMYHNNMGFVLHACKKGSYRSAMINHMFPDEVLGRTSLSASVKLPDEAGPESPFHITVQCNTSTMGTRPDLSFLYISCNIY